MFIANSSGAIGSELGILIILHILLLLFLLL